jgi:hypothetical protein
MNTNKMIERKVNTGHNREESIALLNDLLAQFSKIDNLASALHYNGFISLAAAEKMQLAA